MKTTQLSSAMMVTMVCQLTHRVPNPSSSDTRSFSIRAQDLAAPLSIPADSKGAGDHPGPRPILLTAHPKSTGIRLSSMMLKAHVTLRAFQPLPHPGLPQSPDSSAWSPHRDFLLQLCLSLPHASKAKCLFTAAFADWTHISGDPCRYCPSSPMDWTTSGTCSR